jgi:hypothetical protein
MYQLDMHWLALGDLVKSVLLFKKKKKTDADNSSSNYYGGQDHMGYKQR